MSLTVDILWSINVYNTDSFVSLDKNFGVKDIEEHSARLHSKNFVQ